MPPRPRKHVFRSGSVCDEGCWECRLYDRLLPLAFLLGVLAYLLYFITLAPPLDFPAGTYLKIASGQTLTEVANELKAHQLIRSAALFEGLVRLESSTNTVYAGEYFFSGKENVVMVASRLDSGDYELTPVRLVFYEGMTARQMADQLGQKVPDFDAATFLALATPNEGYLFPDTYFVLPGEDPTTFVGAMKANFDNHIASASSTIAASGKSLSDLVIMASLIEREANSAASRRMVSGILWHRITLGMPLQVDAVFPYIFASSSMTITKDDLKVDSPYNTYLHKGLPPGPIANPGLDSIVAAAAPTKTSDVYYISDPQGNFHYCATYSCQQANVNRYLK